MSLSKAVFVFDLSNDEIDSEINRLEESLKKLRAYRGIREEQHKRLWYGTETILRRIKERKDEQTAQIGKEMP